MVECHDGRIQLSQTCAPGVCAVDDERPIGDAVFCAGDLDFESEDADYNGVDYDIESNDEPIEDEEEDSLVECGPVYGPTGHSCDAQTEGQTFCDFDCKNIPSVFDRPHCAAVQPD
ncbi:hypothetical protein M406DRAFT_73180 [Cryphonectria parasitica EP155]|uniref:Uncharacterized protein n=1 Tax=Cryphonectria parasitica (strain ATCC 38755 / EP155) TaxID=660469 RepID=A0A9P4XTX8_CRYP1|nr:uncharacterized protein M406DRAFT_73180 [Cryphonectria parasitica EP155]KAF3760707.1 hypothetical protein M406DRAFT_73180 [Cryphonectria parasitica EP155]